MFASILGVYASTHDLETKRSDSSLFAGGYARRVGFKIDVAPQLVSGDSRLVGRRGGCSARIWVLVVVVRRYSWITAQRWRWNGVRVERINQQ